MIDKKDKLLVKGTFILKKMPMKGGWTYVELPTDSQFKSEKAFGFIRVKGQIDSELIQGYHVMPIASGQGKYFLPVKSIIRKRIKKEEGDEVEIELYEDNEFLEIPEELKSCLEYEPEAIKRFTELKPSQQEIYIKWIYEVKTEAKKEERILELIEILMKS